VFHLLAFSDMSLTKSRLQQARHNGFGDDIAKNGYRRSWQTCKKDTSCKNQSTAHPLRRKWPRQHTPFLERTRRNRPVVLMKGHVLASHRYRRRSRSRPQSRNTGKNYCGTNKDSLCTLHTASFAAVLHTPAHAVPTME
jgi:hypothetical protein